MCEKDRGERDIIETEKRLALFAEQVTGRGLSDNRRLKLKESRDALETFLQLNVLILNLKKVNFSFILSFYLAVNIRVYAVPICKC